MIGPLEFETEGKIVTLSLEDGHLHCYAMQSRSVLLSLKHAAALNTCCFVDQNIIVAGSQDGSILVADIRTPWLVAAFVIITFVFLKLVVELLRKNRSLPE